MTKTSKCQCNGTTGATRLPRWVGGGRSFVSYPGKLCSGTGRVHKHFRKTRMLRWCKHPVRLRALMFLVISLTPSSRFSVTTTLAIAEPIVLEFTVVANDPLTPSMLGCNALS